MHLWTIKVLTNTPKYAKFKVTRMCFYFRKRDVHIHMKKILSNIGNYFLGVKKEFGRIRWTKGRDLLKYSISTLSFMVFFGVFFSLIDLAVSLLRSI